MNMEVKPVQVDIKVQVTNKCIHSPQSLIKKLLIMKEIIKND